MQFGAVAVPETAPTAAKTGHLVDDRGGVSSRAIVPHGVSPCWRAAEWIWGEPLGQVAKKEKPGWRASYAA